MEHLYFLEDIKEHFVLWINSCQKFFQILLQLKWGTGYMDLENKFSVYFLITQNPIYETKGDMDSRITTLDQKYCFIVQMMYVMY